MYWNQIAYCKNNQEITVASLNVQIHVKNYPSIPVQGFSIYLFKATQLNSSSTFILQFFITNFLNRHSHFYLILQFIFVGTLVLMLHLTSATNFKGFCYIRRFFLFSLPTTDMCDLRAFLYFIRLKVLPQMFYH